MSKLSEIRRGLESSDPDRRLRAILEVGELGASAGPLAPLVASAVADRYLGSVAVQALGRLGSHAKQYFTSIIEAAAYEWCDVNMLRLALRQIVSHLDDGDAQRFVDDGRLFGVSGKENLAIWRCVAWSLGLFRAERVSEKTRNMFERRIGSLMQHEDREVRRNALVAAITFGVVKFVRFEPMLINLMHDVDPEIRRLAVVLAGQFGKSAASIVPCLVALLEHDEIEISVFSADAIVNITDDKQLVLERLLSIASRTVDPLVQRKVFEILNGEKAD
jgi:hypothetical protein